MIVLYSRKPHIARSDWYEVGRTEILKDTDNPDFAVHIVIDYFFEEIQPLRVAVIDVDDKTGANIAKQDFIGSFETNLANVMMAPGQQLIGPLRGKGNGTQGSVTIRGEERIETKQTLSIHFAAEKLDKKDFFGKSDPFLIFYRSREGGQWEVVHKTEIIKQNLNPVWKPLTIAVTKLCNGDIDRPVMIECHDWDSDGSTDFIGRFQTSVREIIGEKQGWQLINPDKKKNDGVSGLVKKLAVSLSQEYSFMDYLIGGCEINLITAIDFTASNGDPRDPKSLHYITSDGQPNQYEKAILAVGNIVAAYDSDGIIPAFGFGAKWAEQVHHCFPFGPNGCVGVSGVLDAYRSTLQSVTLWGPTIFSQVLQMAAGAASQSQSQEHQRYTVLLIITDGVISDMDNALEAIVSASGLPLSIIIVGVGSADFTDMNRLDGDDGLLKSQTGRKAQRDIVQFVPFRDFLSQPYEALAKYTLAEIPGQFMSFMKGAGYRPNPPRMATPSAPDLP